MDFLSDYFDGLLMDMLRGAISDYFISIAHLTNNVQDTVLIDIEDYSPTLFETLVNISEAAVIPVASLIFTYIMTLSFIRICEDRNSFRDSSFMPIFKWILYTGIGVLLISKTNEIVIGIYDVINTMISATTDTLHVDVDLSLQDKLNELVDALDPSDHGTIIRLTIELTVCRLIMWFIAILCRALMYYRIVKMYLYFVGAAIPMATLLDRDRQSLVGENYFKYMAAIGLQGFYTLIVIAIFEVLVTTLITNPPDNISDMIWDSVMYLVVLFLAIRSTKKISTITVGARG